MPPADDADRYDEDDLDERLSRVFEERGWPTPADCRAEDRRTVPAGPARVQARAPAPVAPPEPAAAAPAAPAPKKPAGKPAATQAVATDASPKATPPRRSGRREKTMLLGMLGTLVGAFAGVLSLKLFVPRPPAGTGPDVHLAAAPLDLVEPPALTAPPSAPPSLPDPFRTRSAPAADEALGESAADASPFPRRSAFAESAPVADAAGFAPEPLADSGLPADRLPPVDEPVAHGGLAPAEPPHLHPVPDSPLPPVAASRFAPPTEPPPPGLPAAPAATPAHPRTVLPVAATSVGTERGYVVREGDSWWTIAEGAYGDGRLYKALFAWNRTVDPRTNLSPGTRLEVPDEARLRAAWGRLVPTDGR